MGAYFSPGDQLEGGEVTAAEAADQSGSGLDLESCQYAGVLFAGLRLAELGPKVTEEDIPPHLAVASRGWMT